MTMIFTQLEKQKVAEDCVQIRRQLDRLLTEIGQQMTAYRQRLEYSEQSDATRFTADEKAFMLAILESQVATALERVADANDIAATILASSE